MGYRHGYEDYDAWKERRAWEKNEDALDAEEREAWLLEQSFASEQQASPLLDRRSA